MRFEPMKAVLTDEPFSDPDWIYERKLDGIRVLAYREGDDVRLESRIGRSRNESFPGLVKALRDEPASSWWTARWSRSRGAAPASRSSSAERGPSSTTCSTSWPSTART